MRGLLLALLLTACSAPPEPVEPATPAGPLPALPDLSATAAPIAEQLRAADAAARAELSAETAGALGLAYHANLRSLEAAHAYATAAELAPDEWRWTWLQVLLHQDRGEHEALTEAAARLTERLPEQQLPWFYLGRARFKQGRSEQAEAAWLHAVDAPQRSPRHAALGAVPRRIGPTAAQHASLGLARLALMGGDAQAAEARLKALLASDARFGPAYTLLAEVLRTQGRDPEARGAEYNARMQGGYSPPIDPFVDALALESSSTEFLLRAAGVTQLAGDRSWWERLIRRAGELAPEELEVLSRLGDLAMSQGRVDDALALFERYHELKPDEAVALEAIAACHLRSGRPDEAETALLRAREIDPSSSFANLAVVYEQQGRKLDAVMAWEKRIMQNPGAARAHARLGELLVLERLLPDGEKQLARVVELQPFDPAARITLAGVQMMLGRCADAALHYERALEFTPANVQALGQLAWIQATCLDENTRDGAEALATAERLCTAPGEVQMQCMRTRAAAYAELGRQDEAIDAAEQLVAAARKRLAPAAMGEIEGLLAQIRAGEPIRVAPAAE